MKHLDDQMQTWSPRLRDDLGIPLSASKELASSIAGEVKVLSEDVRTGVLSATPVPLHERLEELKAFQAFMDMAHGIPDWPQLTRAQVIVQNYVCFVYLGDACFRVLRREAPAGSTVMRCCRFLTDNPVRSETQSLTGTGNTRMTSPDSSSGLARVLIRTRLPRDSRCHRTN